MASPNRDKSRIKGDTRAVVGCGRTVWTHFTRPANTTQYTAGDQVGDTATPTTVLTFASVVDRPGECVCITGAVLVSSAYQASPPNFELWLFKTAPTTSNDNAALTVTDANLQGGNFIGRIRLGSDTSSAATGLPTSGAGGNTIVEQDDAVVFPVELADGVTDIYGMLVDRGGYTPISGERFDIGLRVMN